MYDTQLVDVSEAGLDCGDDTDGPRTLSRLHTWIEIVTPEVFMPYSARPPTAHMHGARSLG